MITLTGVSKWYDSGGSQNSHRVLDQLHLHLNQGEFLYIIGGTGAGKSTLLKMIATEDRPSQGRVQLFGYDLDLVSPPTLKAIRQVIGYVPQDIRLLSDFTVFENIAVSLSLAGKRSIQKNAKQKINEILEKLGLIQKRNQLARVLSGGEAQKVAVARALIRAPEVIVADEPTGAQDPDSTWSLMDLLIRANDSGVTTLIATHDRQIVKRIRKSCATLKQGRVSREENVCFY